MATATTTRRIKLSVAAERYGVSVMTLRRRIAEGKLTGYRLGARIIVVDVAELDAMFEPIPTAGSAA